ncbi:MAG TPA: hypothetical protein VH438_12150 [Gemmatimonadales bacterium]
MRVRPKVTAVLLAVSALLPVTTLIAQQNPNETTLQAAGKQYGSGWFHRFLLGSEYREVWTTPITVPVLDMNTYAGGLRAVSKTGGQQSKSLRLQSSDGHQFFFRSIDKDPSGALPAELQQTVAASVARDQTSSALPTAPLVVGRLLTAAGILHAEPTIVVLPDVERMGEFRADFAGLMGTLEERVGGSGPAAHWGGATEIVLTDTLYARLERSSADQVDGSAFLKARLFDVLIGDWDRHRDQWRWAYFGDSVPRRWVPIPLDRDQAFAKYDGFLLWIARQSAFQLTNFQGEYSSPVGAAWNGRDLDRRLLTGLSWSDWEAVVNQLTSALSDSVIQNAVEALPPEHYQIIGSRLTAWLTERREGLAKEARKYYQMLAGEVDLTATDSGDVVTATRDETGVEVTLAPREAPDKFWFRRRFLAKETSDIRVFLRNGNDSVLVSGNGGEPTVRILADQGDDVMVDSAASGSNRFYDDPAGPQHTLGKNVGIDRRPYVLPPRPEGQLPPRDWGHRWQGMIWASYGPDLGVFFGAGVTYTRYGFRKLPFSERHRIRAGFATGPGSYRFDYRGEFHRENSRGGFLLLARASGIDVLNFHGYGNETSDSGSAEFYRVTQDAYTVAPLFLFPLASHGDIAFGPYMKYASTDKRTDRFLATVNPYGSGNFGEVGVGVTLRFDTKNRRHAATRGWTFEVTGRMFPAWWDVEEDFGDVAAEAATFLSPKLPLHPTFAFRAGGKKIWGPYPFFEAAYIGDAGTVRLGRDGRYAGDASAYGNAELRLALGRATIVLPTDFGVFGLADAGRVFLEGENSDVWHSAFGGGIWLAPIARDYTVSAAVAAGDERTALYVQAGFAF